MVVVSAMKRKGMVKTQRRKKIWNKGKEMMARGGVQWWTKQREEWTRGARDRENKGLRKCPRETILATLRFSTTRVTSSPRMGGSQKEELWRHLDDVLL
ncbi:hypothetical protein RJT34_12341 [Clitoria ternatea]|uniref:Uncharacterized protein n=1 Tax=Clitoria ternatea TaxID=43366 RepID=A0AAN9PKD9_CLITE